MTFSYFGKDGKKSNGAPFLFPHQIQYSGSQDDIVQTQEISWWDFGISILTLPWNSPQKFHTNLEKFTFQIVVYQFCILVTN